jgi:hypothetical protein
MPRLLCFLQYQRKSSQLQSRGHALCQQEVVVKTIEKIEAPEIQIVVVKFQARELHGYVESARWRMQASIFAVACVMR